MSRLFLLLQTCVLSALLVSMGLAQRRSAPNLEETMRTIAAEEEVMLAYDPAKLQKLPPPSSLPQGKSLERVNALLRPYGFQAEWVRKPRAIVVELPPSIRGVVRDENGETLPFAKVYITGGNATLSDKKGRFELQVQEKEKHYEVITDYLGFSPDTIHLKPAFDKMYTIRLSGSAMQLEEIRIEDGLTQQLRVSDAASQASINPKAVSTLSGLGEPDIFRASQLLPGIQAGGLSSGGLQIRGGTPDQTLTRFDGITAYRVDHFFGLFGAFNSRAVRQVDVYRGGYGARFGGRASGVIDIEGRNGSFEKPHIELGINLFNSSLLIETPLIKDKVSLLVAGRKSYMDVVESPFYKRFFNNVFSPPEEVADESVRELIRNGNSSEDFLDSYEQFRFDPTSIANLSQNAPEQLTRSPIDFRAVNRDYLREAAEPSFEFSDLHVRLAIRPSKKGLITISGFQGSDFLAYNYNDQPRTGIDVDITDELKLKNKGASLRWKRHWSSIFSSNTTFAYSEHTNSYQYHIKARDDSSEVATELTQTHGIRDFSIRSEHKVTISKENTINFGAELSNIHLRYGMDAGDTLFLGRRMQERTFSWYLENQLNPLPQLRITAGMRSTFYSKTGNWFPTPRIQVRYTPQSPWRLKAAWGMYNQFLSRIRVNNGLGLGEDFYAFGGDEDIPVVTSTHAILGGAWEHKGWLIDIEGYVKSTRGLITYAHRSDLLEIDEDGNGELISNGESKIQGIDVLIQKTSGKHTGWIGYSLSNAWQRFPDINKGIAFPTLQDQRHELKFVNQIKLKNWELAATWIWSSGRPYTEATDSRTIDGQEPNTDEYELVIGQRNAARLPAYHRLDLSATYHWTLWGGKMETGISVYNAYFRRNIRQRRYVLITPNQSWQSPTISQADVYDLGISPNIFWKLRF